MIFKKILCNCFVNLGVIVWFNVIILLNIDWLFVLYVCWNVCLIVLLILILYGFMCLIVIVVGVLNFLIKVSVVFVFLILL